MVDPDPVLFQSLDDAIIELTESINNSLLTSFIDKIYADNSDYTSGQSDRAVIAKWKTNVRYQMSEVPSVPIFGYKQVDISASFSPVTLLSNLYSDATSFLNAFSQIIWVTYRFGFDPIIHNDLIFTSDTGWGCTIRVGQMLWLNTLRLHFRTENFGQLLELIQENFSQAPYSLHKVVQAGKKYGMQPGDWYSPALMSNVIRDLANNRQVPGLRVRVFMDCVIFRSRVPKDSGCLVMIPLMLGIGEIQNKYYEAVRCFLRLKWSVGIIGGIPKSALYIVGYQDEDLLFLDPHFVQPACTSGQDLINKLGSYQCSSPKLLPIHMAESSISVGFYFKDFGEFKEFELELKKNSEVLNGILSVKEEDLTCEDSMSESEEDYVLI